MKLLSWVKKHSNGIFIVVFCIVVLLPYIPNWYKAAAAKWRMHSAKKTAVSFCEKKYGFKPEVYIKEEKFQFEHYGFVAVTAQKTKDHDEFVVFVSDKEDPTRCFDQFQFNDIKKSFEKELNKALPGGKLDYLLFERRPPTSCRYYFVNCFEKYYDGKNLDEVIEGCKGTFTMFYHNKKFDECLSSRMTDGLKDHNMNAEFVSFNDKKIMNEVLKQEPYYQNDVLVKYLPYIIDTKFVKCKENPAAETTSHDYDDMLCKKDSGEFFYSPYEKDLYVYGVGFYKERYTEVELEAVGKEAFKDEFNSFLSAEAFDGSLTDVYKQSSDGDFYVYFPLEKADGLGVDDIEAAWVIGDSSKNGIVSAEKIGDYAVFEIPENADAFMLIDKNKN